MKNMKVGLKIGLGFGILILISCVLGGMAVWSMNSVGHNAARMAGEYVPEVEIANNLERSAQQAMYAMRGYAMSEAPAFREQALRELSELDKHIAKAQEHAKAYPGLVRLNKDAQTARQKLDEYSALGVETQKRITGLAAQRKRMDETAAAYVAAAHTWMENQGSQFENEIKNAALQGIILERWEKIAKLQGIIELGTELRVRNFKSQAVDDPKIIEEALGNFGKMDALLEYLKDKTFTATNLKALSDVQESLASYNKAVDDFLVDWKALKQLETRSAKAGEELLEAAKATAAAGISTTRAIADQGVGDLSRASSVMVAGLVAALILGVAIAVYLTRLITRPLLISVAYADLVASGNLEGRLDVRQGDEVGRLADSLRTMVGNLKERIREADAKSQEASREAERARQAMAEAEAAQQDALAKRDAMLEAAVMLQRVAEVTSSASEELSAQIEQSSRGAEQQSARVSETATAMDQMNATVLEVAKNAAEAAETSGRARGQAQDGAAIVGQVVDGIGAVQKQALALKEDMAALGVRAEGIGAVMNVISDIADQTNLLALNAAIEAARAGEAGRGFAVVADEVRKLAEKTMQATREVGEAIQGIQESARTNMANVDAAVRAIQDSTGLAGKSGESLNEIVHLVDMATDQVRSIATASEEQSAASEQISRSIEEVSTISSETAQAMVQASQAVAELAGQTAELTRLIERMRSGDDSGARALAPAGRSALR